MGMFDYVSFEINCPCCGTLLNEFQTKDGGCYLERISPLEAIEFYEICNNCGISIDFILKDIYKKEVLEKTFIRFLESIVSADYEDKKTIDEAKTLLNTYTTSSDIKEEVLKRFKVVIKFNSIESYAF